MVEASYHGIMPWLPPYWIWLSSSAMASTSCNSFAWMETRRSCTPFGIVAVFMSVSKVNGNITTRVLPQSYRCLTIPLLNRPTRE